MTDVLPPRRPGTEIRALQVFAGFGLGLLVSWGLRWPLLSLAMEQPENPTVQTMMLALFVPSAVLVAAFVWALSTRRKGLAVGMAIYAGVGGLILVPVSTVFLLCGTR